MHRRWSDANKDRDVDQIPMIFQFPDYDTLKLALTSGVGDPYKMELADGALTAWPMGVTLGSVMAFDRGRNTIVAQEVEEAVDSWAQRSGR